MMLRPHQPRMISPKQEIEPPSGVLQQLLLLPALPPSSPNNSMVLIPQQETAVSVLNKPQMPPQKPYFSSVKGYLADNQGVGPICRTCYRVIYNNNFIKLYEEENKEISEKLQNMLKQVVRTIDLEIYAEPIMCTKCVKKLFECHEFLTKCWDTEVKFNHWVSQRKRVRQEEVNLLILVENSTNEDELQDPIVTKQPPKQKKVEVVNVSTSENAQNDNSVKMDHSYSNLNDSVLTDHNYAGPWQTARRNKKKFNYEVKLSRAEKRRQRRAMQERKRGPFLCELCGFLAKSRISFSMHLESHEGNPVMIDGLYHCEKCPFGSKDSYILKKHVMGHTEPIHKCTECGKSYKGEKALQLHIKNIHTDNPASQQCHICGKSFKYQTSLRIHLQIHNPERPLPYICEFCGKRFANRNVCQKHLLTHSGLSYTCEICGRVLKRKQTLRKHCEIYHENNGKFTCDVCNRSFWREEHLTKHKVKHVTFSNENKCDICQMYYPCRGKLLNHLAEVHGKLFECQHCGVKLKTQQAMKNHQHMHHGDGVKFKCEICNKGYRRKAIWLQHAFKVHGVTVEEEQDVTESAERQEEETSHLNFEDFNLDKENVLVEPIEVLGFF